MGQICSSISSAEDCPLLPCLALESFLDLLLDCCYMRSERPGPRSYEGRNPYLRDVHVWLVRSQHERQILDRTKAFCGPTANRRPCSKLINGSARHSSLSSASLA